MLRTPLKCNDASISLWTEEKLTKCFDGFLLICANDGTIFYASESISLYIGFTQVAFIMRLLVRLPYLLEFEPPIDAYRDVNITDDSYAASE